MLALGRHVTRSMCGILQPNQRHDGTMAWSVTHLVEKDSDSSTESKKIRIALGLPYWRDAMKKEYATLIQNQTWKLVPPCSGLNTIDCKWVFRVKRKSDGKIERYKS